jgi:hypothetical protein
MERAHSRHFRCAHSPPCVRCKRLSDSVEAGSLFNTPPYPPFARGGNFFCEARRNNFRCAPIPDRVDARPLFNTPGFGGVTAALPIAGLSKSLINCLVACCMVRPTNSSIAHRCGYPGAKRIRDRDFTRFRLTNTPRFVPRQTASSPGGRAHRVAAAPWRRGGRSSIRRYLATAR